ncbi:sigma-54-dependent Fis family transcriptional regulator [Ancylobacter sp. MQZ15Z-1]|uniref:Sigma-54-dependent Fis family transcriptional regulator n=1 Tax=Ancylobacter mangrovi TaxID=2972472 RepID=A0A9X2T474_9HYPH|nr:sigma-54-dependent Fis family transcriptional regulator [Ancylobacter mangrovi]MCS0495726.1 sigma-54-dependent Fis family transcriptional regulator [Ancylobacter mangrovi]
MMHHGRKILEAVRLGPGRLPLGQDFPYRSWSRCVEEYGLEPGRCGPIPLVSHREINTAREALEDKLVFAYEEVDFLYSVVGKIGYCVTLTNADGLTLAERADRSSRFYSDTERPGSVWTERFAGTNGVGTCLRDGAVTSVYQDEHFFEDFIEMSCAAVPLFAPDASLWAALNVTVRNPSLQRETHAIALEVVRKSAERLSEAIFRRSHGERTILKLWKPDGEPCLLAVDADHAVVGADVAARAFLKLPRTDFSPFSLWRLFARDPAAIRNDPGPSLPMRLTRLDGTELRGYVYGPSAPNAAPRARPAPARAAAGAAEAGGVTLDQWAGAEPRMTRSVDILRRLSRTGLPILLLGETGVGKDTLARAYHAESPRAAQPFVALNCAAMPETLIESELFGYAGGAFTGARKEGSAGRFVQAHGGTLFLDEIGDMPPHLQTRLLRVLESGEVAPLGSGKIRKVDVQVIAATNHRLEQRIADGAFRADLYYRLAGVIIHVPTLRERADKEAVIDACIACTAGRLGVRVAPAARRILLQHSWPGNLRELYLVVSRAVSLAEGKLIEPHDLLLTVPAMPPDPLHAQPEARAPAGPSADVRARLDEAERAAILDNINACRGDVAAAAHNLGMSRATLYRRLKAHGITRRG